MLLVTSIRDAVGIVETLAHAIVAQTRPPDRWLAADLGSRDGSRNLLRRLECQIRFLDVLYVSPAYRSLDRAATFDWSLRQTFTGAFTHVGQIGVGVTLAPSDLERTLALFAVDARLGMVRGPATVYSAACLAALRARGGIEPEAEHEGRARLLGFHTLSWPLRAVDAA